MKAGCRLTLAPLFRISDRAWRGAQKHRGEARRELAGGKRPTRDKACTFESEPRRRENAGKVVLAVCLLLTACGLPAEEGGALGAAGGDALAAEIGSTAQALSTSAIKGHVEAVTKIDGAWYISGWACERAQSRSINVKFYASTSPSNYAASDFVRTTRANLASSATVATACSSTLLLHRFRIQIPGTTLQLRGGRYVHVLGVKATDGHATAPLTGSGTLQVPRLEEHYPCTAASADACVFPSVSASNTRAIIAQSGKADTTTHTLSSGNVTLGIGSFGGGYINQLVLPGVGDIVGTTSSRFGRGGQSALRDRLHKAVYNPTQAGFSDVAGTSVRVRASSQSLVVPPRRLALYNGDGNYDFVESTDLAPDGYSPPDADQDNYNDTGSQLDEVSSEFDFYGSYKNCRDGRTVTIPCFKHYYEYRFVRTRQEVNTLRQFINGVMSADGSSVLDHTLLAKSVTDRYGPAIANTDAYDLGTLISRWTLRFDNAVWNPGFLFYLKRDHSLTRAVTRQGARSEAALLNKIGRPLEAGYEKALILSTASNPTQGLALALYKPGSTANAEPVVTKTFDGRALQHESRRTSDDMFDNNATLSNVELNRNMSKVGFTDLFSGLLNPSKLNSSSTAPPDRKYELLRSEVYLLVGTAAQIRDAITQLIASAR